MKEIKLAQNKFAIVDDEDYPYLNRFKWSLNNGNYVVLQIQRKKEKITSIKLPEFILGKKHWWEDFIYKNKNPLDNRKENIMIGDHSSKLSYSRKTSKISTSIYKGVSWNKSKNRWRARINFHCKEYHLGFYKSEKEAGIAYNEKSLELFGDFAYQNKIEN